MFSFWKKPESPAVAREDALQPIQSLLQYWPSRSSKIDDFHLIWKGVCDFLLVISSNLGLISHRFQDTATYSSKPSIENCGQTAADEDLVTIDNL